MIDADKTKLDAIFNRLSQLFEITFPVAAGWRPNIHVSRHDADTGSVAYETLQIDYMMRALIASADIQLRPEMQRGVHIKELVSDDARIVNPDLPTATNAKVAEHWLARRTGDDSYFANAVSEARTNLSSAVEALEGFTRTVAERLSRLGARVDSIDFSMLVPHEQRQYEQMYARLMDIRTQLSRALRDQNDSISQADIDAQQQELEQRVRNRLMGKAAALPHVVHPDEAGVVLKMPTVAFGSRAPVAPEPVILPEEPRFTPREARDQIRETVAPAPVAVAPVAAEEPDVILPRITRVEVADMPPVYSAVELPDEAPLMAAAALAAAAPELPVAQTVHTAPLAAEEDELEIESPFIESHPVIAGTQEEAESDSDGGFSYVGGFKPMAPRTDRPVQQRSSNMFPLHFLNSALHHKQHRNDKKSAN